MDNTFIIDGIEYKVIRQPGKSTPIITRIDNLPIKNRIEVCRKFLKTQGWNNEMFINRTTNDLERYINKIINGSYIPKNLEGIAISEAINKKKKAKQIDSVIVVRMYAGDYLNENIGHEIINTFKTDNGDHFLYINPWGTVNSLYKNSKHVLLVRGISADIWEVMGYGTNLELLLSQEALNNKRHHEIELIDSDIQLKLIKERGITYGGVPINEILSEQKNVVYATYQVHEYHSSKEDRKLYLVDKESEVKGDNYIFLPNVNFGRQTLRQYMDEVKCKDAYETLLNLFKDPIWWDEDTCHKIENINNYFASFNILDIIKKDEDELVFSNWLAYYLMNDTAFLIDFAHDLLGVKINTNAIVRREYRNIDIWIEDDNNIIVIENKIKSGINGVVEERHDFSKGEVKSQLSKYVAIATEEARGRETTFKLLIPDYGVKDEELSIYKEYEKYLPALRYSALLKFIESHNRELPYYEDYKRAIKKHSSLYCKNLYQIMEERLINKIKSKKLIA